MFKAHFDPPTAVKDLQALKCQLLFANAVVTSGFAFDATKRRSLKASRACQ
jgi:hypothetical protein